MKPRPKSFPIKSLIFINLDFDSGEAATAVPDIGLPHNANVKIHPGEEWACAHEKGVQLLLSQTEHTGTHESGFSSSVSLVSFKDVGDSSRRNVAWVQWTAPGVTGRVAELDSSNCLKAIVPVRENRKPIDFRCLDMTILWQDTGVRNVKAQWKRNQEQNRMPEHLIRLKDMWSLAEDSNKRLYDAEGGHWGCFICTAIASPQLPEQQAMRCSLCLLPSHKCCMHSLMLSIDRRVCFAIVHHAQPCNPCSLQTAG